MKSTLTFIVLCFIATSVFAAGYQQIKIFNIPKEALIYPIGRLDPGKRLHLVIELPLRNKAQRDQLLQGLYDPKSPNYGHYLTPQEFTQLFGPTMEDYDHVATFFKNKGFKVTTTPSRTLLDIDGTVRMIELTFHTTLREYRHPTENRNFYAPDEDPSVDLGVPLEGIAGLDNYTRIHPVWGDHPHFKPISSIGAKI